MLDEPDSLTRLPEALKQIDPLVEARELLAVAQTQAQDPRRHREDPAALRLGVLRPRHHRPGRRADGAGLHRPRPARAVPGADRRRSTAPSTNSATSTRTSPAQLNLAKAEGGFAQRADQRIQRQHRPAAVAGGRRRGAGRAGVAPPRRLRRRCSPRRTSTIPDTADEFWNLREELAHPGHRAARQARPRPGGVHRRRVRAEGRAHRPRRRRQGTQARRARRLGAAGVRASRCANTSAPQSVSTPTELPYIAELLDLRPDQSRWRVAVEKVLRGVGLRLLVPDQHYAAVLRFVNETDMRRPAAAAPRPRQARRRRARRRRAEHVGGQAVRRRPDASVRRRGRRRHRRRRRPHLRRHPGRVRPVPPRGHRHRAVQGLRPAGHQGRPATAASSPSTSTRATWPPRSTR